MHFIKIERTLRKMIKIKAIYKLFTVLVQVGLYTKVWLCVIKEKTPFYTELWLVRATSTVIARPFHSFLCSTVSALAVLAVKVNEMLFFTESLGHRCYSFFPRF